jgi:hypothetical protein
MESLWSPERELNPRPAHYEGPRHGQFLVLFRTVADASSTEPVASHVLHFWPRQPALEAARLRRHLRLVPRGLAYCRPASP